MKSTTSMVEDQQHLVDLGHDTAPWLWLGQPDRPAIAKAIT